jgi:hypothetical protein
MSLNFQQLTKDLSKMDLEDLVSCWNWLLGDMASIAIITCLGDMFLVGKDGAIYWLQTDSCNFTKVAEDIKQFEQFLIEDDKIDNWFLPLLVEKLIKEGKILKENEVYSFKLPTALGGKYSVDNIETADISVHFAFSGQICEQIKDLPAGTKIKNVFFKKG